MAKIWATLPGVSAHAANKCPRGHLLRPMRLPLLKGSDAPSEKIPVLGELLSGLSYSAGGREFSVHESIMYIKRDVSRQKIHIKQG